MATLMIDNGPTRADALMTRTGGVPLAPPDTEWPTCSTCGGPMQFLAQVLLDDVRNGVDSAGRDRGVLALFACQNDPGMCEDWDPTAGGNRALLLPSHGLQPLPLPQLDDESVLVLGAVRAVTTEHEGEADYDQARETWAARTGRPDTEVLGQLGGTPAWIQGDETPTCPQCARPMPLAVQLEEGPDHSTAMNFGAGGCAYAFTCEPCAQATLLWQC
ncbi:DUF1963 domain-containing protein [Kitasatospora sp. NPDC053057]|uniref:DUF1963 domain-containing protein n=1 Tax=Kitasatospora sp. NPDC053057 TaxID=3364062 RepID=UPI0037C5C0EF